MLNLPAQDGAGASFPYELSADRHAIKTIVTDQKPWSNWYDFPGMHWAILGMTDAAHPSHTDADGLGTGVFCCHGVKWWIIALPPGMDYTHFRNIKFVENAHDRWLSKALGWKILVVRLTPGMKMYILF